LVIQMLFGDPNTIWWSKYYLVITILIDGHFNFQRCIQYTDTATIRMIKCRYMAGDGLQWWTC
jgi:hypothetical protein